MASSSGASGGVGFWGLLLLLFIGLRLGNVIDWSWWWVMSPVWIWLALALVFTLLAVAANRPSRRRRGF